MDQKGRDANKRYRNKVGDLETISLLIDTGIYKKLEKAVDKEPDKNMSKFLEETFGKIKFTKFKGNRPYKSGELTKKTFTFSKSFSDSLRRSGNMSVTIENLLKEKFDK